VSKKTRVVLRLDIYQHIDKSDRYWQREVWVGEMPQRNSPSEYDPLLLQKEYEYGAENVLFRLDEYDREKNEVVYRPAVFHNTHWFLEALSNWGFKKESAVNREQIA
jgi:hypothetical protein